MIEDDKIRREKKTKEKLGFDHMCRHWIVLMILFDF